MLKKDLLQGKQIRIVFIGDSITSTEWVHPNWREIIEYVLKEELTRVIKDWKLSSWGVRCFNCGFDGSTTGDIIKMLGNRILSLKPGIIIWMVNTNDRHFKVSIQKFNGNIQKILKKFSKCESIIFCNTIPANDPKKKYPKDDYANATKNIRFGKNVMFVDTYNEMLKFNLNRFFTFKSTGNPVLGIKPGDLDFVHPNQLGNAYITKIILEKAFKVKFNPERYISDTLKGEMYPEY